MKTPNAACSSFAETGRYDGGFLPFKDAVTTAVDMANAAFMRDGHLSGISTGIHALDSKMGGLQPSDLIILAGRPGMGKTSLATNIAFNIANAYEPDQQADGTIKAANGGVVGFFSLEMSRRTARHPYYFRANGSVVLENPPRRNYRNGF